MTYKRRTAGFGRWIALSPGSIDIRPHFTSGVPTCIRGSGHVPVVTSGPPKKLDELRQIGRP